VVRHDRGRTRSRILLSRSDPLLIISLCAFVRHQRDEKHDCSPRNNHCHREGRPWCNAHAAGLRHETHRKCPIELRYGGHYAPTRTDMLSNVPTDWGSCVG
jgi:hypothetical protein